VYDSEEDACDREEDACDREEDHCHVNEYETNQQYSDSQSPILDTIDKLTQPTKCSLFDGTRNNVEPALDNIFPFQKTCYTVPMQYGYVVVQPTYMQCFPKQN
jgi:sorbitol-specific phosphotransferase system component IIBC